MELRPAELFKEWKAGKFRPAYCLVGEEASAKTAAVKQLKELFAADDFNLRVFSGDAAAEASDIVSEAMTLPVFAEKRLVIVDNPKIPAEARGTLAEYLKDPVKSTTLVLLSEEKKPDPKDPLLKAVSACGAVCVFSPLKEEEAQERLKLEARKAGKSMTEEACAALVAEAGTDWGILSQELEKAVLFSPSSTIGAQEVLQCLGYQKASDPFALARLIQDRDLKGALAQLRRFLQDGKPDEQAFKALSQISAAVNKQFRAKRMVKAGISSEEVFRSLRLHSWWDRDYLNGLKRFPEERLISDLKKCLETETSLKSKSWLEPRIELEQLVVGLCGGLQALGAAS